MKVALVGEGTYPIVSGGVSTWCNLLFRALPEHEFHVVTLVGDRRDVVCEIPTNVASIELHPIWGRVEAGSWRHNRDRGALSRALTGLWQALLPARVGSGGDHLDEVAGWLRALALIADRTSLATLLALALIADRTSLATLLAESGSARHVLEAWQQHARGHGLPRMSPAVAGQVGLFADSILRSLDAPIPQVDLLHSAANGPALLACLRSAWRDGTPLLLTEHGVYLRERYLALEGSGLDSQARSVLMKLIRAICVIGYRESVLTAPVSDFNGRWARQLGAAPEKVITVFNGIDRTAYPPCDSEPEVPTVAFVGRIDPLKDLHTLVAAFALVRAEVPDARLRLFGPVPAGNEDYRDSVVDRVTSHGLDEAVTFEGPCNSSRVAALASHVVALSSISEGLPFTVMEAMMCGRATVNTDVGGVGEVVGSDGQAGVVVPPRDPRALADALIALLSRDDYRREMGERARERALSLFTLERFRDNHRAVYGFCVGVGTLVGLPTLTGQPVADRWAGRAEVA